MASRRPRPPSGKPALTPRGEREALISDLEATTVSRRFPRLQLSLIVVGAGLGGFLTSVGLLHAGVDVMWLRYAVAVASGYLAFLALLQVWIALHRWERAGDGADGVIHDGADGDTWSSSFAGGRSGGGGGGARWGDGDARGVVAPSHARASTGGTGSDWFGGLSVDADDAAWLVVAGALVCAGAIAVGYVIWIAPALLAEVMLDAALVTTMYRRLRPHDVQHWSVGVMRRTWLPALVVALCLSGAGYALQRVAPDARSIGGVLAHLSE
ncbi:hypothetical protein TBR22_A23350 [Luteitalea sp. TBR-22]|uniref:hypothetical protein n=1 Tax=Luteitalea sp. TBR-22 TaxID=2802971 RepID=UPI001AFC69C9|nr:hypothetical protein [Luteitalea sp. TBR-22]BCS33109.1 hypothetical protein TBR22_A23350 [Luteitalea sp. TBR-22]